MKTVEFLRQFSCLILAEIGVGEGKTSEQFARYLNGRGELHIFDFCDRVETVVSGLKAKGFQNIVGHPNSRKMRDDYNWSLMKILQFSRNPIFDYVYIDGAHTWHSDALAFSLLERLLKIGGFMEFDDYHWTHLKSPTVNPKVCSATVESYTDEQIGTPQIGLVIDLLVKRDVRFKEIQKNRIYQKLR